MLVWGCSSASITCAITQRLLEAPLMQHMACSDSSSSCFLTRAKSHYSTILRLKKVLNLSCGHNCICESETKRLLARNTTYITDHTPRDQGGRHYGENYSQKCLSAGHVDRAACQCADQFYGTCISRCSKALHDLSSAEVRYFPISTSSSTSMLIHPHLNQPSVWP